MAEQRDKGADEPLSLMKEMGLTEDSLDQRKAFLEFGDEDVQRLLGLKEFVREHVGPVVESFYRHLLSFEEGRAFFQDPATLERVKELQKRYFIRLTEGNYGEAYAEHRLNVGAVHERIGLPVDLYLGMYSFVLGSFGSRLFDAWRDRPGEALASFFALMKLVFLDMGLSMATYIARREQVISRQAEAFRELPTPVLQVRDGILILPLVGVLESRRAYLLTEQLLNSIRDTRSRVAILDITGVPVVDSKVANHLLQTVSAARLMGATVILTGLSPQIAQALVAIGMDLRHVRTMASLQGGLEEAERLLGYHLAPIGDHR